MQQMDCPPANALPVARAMQLKPAHPSPPSRKAPPCLVISSCLCPAKGSVQGSRSWMHTPARAATPSLPSLGLSSAKTMCTQAAMHACAATFSHQVGCVKWCSVQFGSRPSSSITSSISWNLGRLQVKQGAGRNTCMKAGVWSTSMGTGSIPDAVEGSTSPCEQGSQLGHRHHAYEVWRRIVRGSGRQQQSAQPCTICCSTRLLEPCT